MLPFLYKEVGISIHAPRVGRDRNWRHDFPPLSRIYGYPLHKYDFLGT